MILKEIFNLILRNDSPLILDTVKFFFMLYYVLVY
jgi:hypothetical protein